MPDALSGSIPQCGDGEAPIVALGVLQGKGVSTAVEVHASVWPTPDARKEAGDMACAQLRMPSLRRCRTNLCLRKRGATPRRSRITPIQARFRRSSISCLRGCRLGSACADGSPSGSLAPVDTTRSAGPESRRRRTPAPGAASTPVLDPGDASVGGLSRPAARRLQHRASAWRARRQPTRTRRPTSRPCCRARPRRSSPSQSTGTPHTRRHGAADSA